MTSKFVKRVCNDSIEYFDFFNMEFFKMIVIYLYMQKIFCINRLFYWWSVMNLV